MLKRRLRNTQFNKHRTYFVYSIRIYFKMFYYKIVFFKLYKDRKKIFLRIILFFSIYMSIFNLFMLTYWLLIY